MQGAGSWAGCCFNSPDSCLSSYRALLPLISGLGMPLSPASYCPALRHVAVHSCHLEVQGRLPGAQKVVRRHSVHSGPSVTGKDILPQCSQGPCEGQMGLRIVSGLSGSSLGEREEPRGVNPDTCMPAALLTPPVCVCVLFSRGGTGKISARLAKSLGLPSAGEGQAGMRRPGRPQFLPQVLVPLASGKGELISELHPKQRAEGSSASWGPVLALLLACSSTCDKLFGPLSPDQALPRGHPQGPPLDTRAQGSKLLARLNLCPSPVSVTL